ncbi:MAG: hypothetical protein ACOYUK_01910 [Patescibacteria group bacterium]
MNDLHDAFSALLDWATDPEGMGLPIVIGVGLGMILYFMKSSEKGWQKADRQIAEHKDRRGNIGFPDKPF